MQNAIRKHIFFVFTMKNKTKQNESLLATPFFMNWTTISKPPTLTHPQTNKQTKKRANNETNNLTLTRAVYILSSALIMACVIDFVLSY